MDMTSKNYIGLLCCILQVNWIKNLNSKKICIYIENSLMNRDVCIITLNASDSVLSNDFFI
ncbi:hypothetical protein GCM10025860_00460 [Methanobacterium ferruginis]|nr:hypothetical protein GCM10025860_00460 [Methanobacterium ferruginis]